MRRFALLLCVLLTYPSSSFAQSFSLALDANSASGNQSVLSVNASANQSVSIQVFGNGLTDANAVNMRFEFDANQVTYESFTAGSALPGAQALPNQGMGFVEVFGGRATASSGMLGTIGFRTTASFKSASIRLVRGELRGRGSPIVIMPNLTIALSSALSPDFDGDGEVGFNDFVLFAGAFGAERGQNRFDARFDLDSSGDIGFGDFVEFAGSFGQPVGTGGGGGGMPTPVLTATKPKPDKILRGGSSMSTVTATGFAADANIEFTYSPEPEDAPFTASEVTKTADSAMVTLTATDEITVTVTATDGTIISDPVSIPFLRAPYLMAADTLAVVSEGSSTTVRVTAVHFPTVIFDSTIKQADDGANVTTTREGNVFTVTSHRKATVEVTATDPTNPAISDTIEIRFKNAPKLMANANMVLVHRDSSVKTAMATVTAMGFDPDASVSFRVMSEDEDALEDPISEDTMVTLIATDATTVTVTATDGEIETLPISIEFRLDPYLMVDKVSPVVIPPGDSAKVKVTVMDYPDGAEITFNRVTGIQRGVVDFDLVDQEDADDVATLTVSGSGSAILKVEATVGTTPKTATIAFIQPPELTVSEGLSDSLITIPLVDGEAGSVEGSVTASNFPADAALEFSVDIQTEDAAEVDTTFSGTELTLTARGSGSATVMVSVSSGKYEHLKAGPDTLQFIHPRLVADKDSLIISPDTTIVATITAKDFPAEAEVKFDIRKEADESVTVEQAIGARGVVLTARGSGSATVTVMASSGEGEDKITAAPAVIQFDQPAPIDPPDPPDPPGPQPAPMSDADEYVIPPDGNVMATITAMNFPEGAKITFNWVKVDAEGPEVTIDEMASQGKLTLTVSGSGTATVEVKATDGVTSVAKTIRFIQPSLMLVSDAEDNQVMIPHNGRGMVMVTAEGPLPAGAVVAFAVTPEDAVEWTPDGVTLTLTSNSAATVTVMASAAEGKIAADPITIQFIE